MTSRRPTQIEAHLSQDEKTVLDAIFDLDELMSKYADFGAADTEPDVEKQLGLRRALIQGEPHLPETAQDWQLYTHGVQGEDLRQTEAAAMDMHQALVKVDALIRKLEYSSRVRLSTLIDLWRVQEIDWDCIW